MRHVMNLCCVCVCVCVLKKKSTNFNGIDSNVKKGLYLLFYYYNYILFLKCVALIYKQNRGNYKILLSVCAFFFFYF